MKFAFPTTGYRFFARLKLVIEMRLGERIYVPMIILKEMISALLANRKAAPNEKRLTESLTAWRVNLFTQHLLELPLL